MTRYCDKLQGRTQKWAIVKLIIIMTNMFFTMSQITIAYQNDQLHPLAFDVYSLCYPTMPHSALPDSVRILTL